MTEGQVETIFETDDHSAELGIGVEVAIAVDDDGRVSKVCIINEADEELVELDHDVAVAAARAILKRLEDAPVRQPQMLDRRSTCLH